MATKAKAKEKGPTEEDVRRKQLEAIEEGKRILQGIAQARPPGFPVILAGIGEPPASTPTDPAATEAARKRQDLTRQVEVRMLERSNLAINVLHQAAAHRIATGATSEYGADTRAEHVQGDVALAFDYADAFLERSRLDRIALAKKVGLDPTTDLGPSFSWPFREARR